MRWIGGVTAAVATTLAVALTGLPGTHALWAGQAEVAGMTITSGRLAATIAAGTTPSGTSTTASVPATLFSGMVPGEVRGADLTIANTGTTPVALRAAATAQGPYASQVSFSLEPGACAVPAVATAALTVTPAPVAGTIPAGTNARYCLTATIGAGLPANATAKMLVDAFTLSLQVRQPAAPGGWGSALTASGSVSAGWVSAAVRVTPANATFTNAALSSASVVEVDNTLAQPSGAPGEARLRLTANPTTGLAANLPVSVWPIQNSAECTTGTVPPAGAVTGTWGQGVTSAAAIVPSGSTGRFCVLSAAASRSAIASATGTASFTAQITATVAFHAFTASAATSGSYKTTNIFPSGATGNFWYRMVPTTQSLCVDVSGGGNARLGALVGTYACHSQLIPALANQWFTMTPISAGHVAIRAAMPANTYFESRGATVTVENRNSASLAQSWEPQLVATNTYQLVSSASGLCLTAPAAAGSLTTAPCTGAALQKFRFDQLAVTPPTPA